MEDDGACPDGFQLLHDERVCEELLGLGANGYLDCRGAGRTRTLDSPGAARSGGAGSDQTLQRVEVVAQRVDEFAGGVLLQQAHGQQLTGESPRVVHAHISWVRLGLLPELQTVGQEAVDGAAREVGRQDLLLDGLDEELRDLRGAQLVPGEGGLASLDDDYAYAVGGVVDGDAVWRGGGGSAQVGREGSMQSRKEAGKQGRKDGRWWAGR